MERVSVEKMLAATGSSVYKLVVLVTKRALEIVAGAPKLTDVSLETKPISVAMKEIAEGKVKYKETKG